MGHRLEHFSWDLTIIRRMTLSAHPKRSVKPLTSCNVPVRSEAQSSSHAISILAQGLLDVLGIKDSLAPRGAARP